VRQELGVIVACVGQDAGAGQCAERLVDDLDLALQRLDLPVRVVPVHHVLLPSIGFELMSHECCLLYGDEARISTREYRGEM
jgi:hypothetical protein